MKGKLNKQQKALIKNYLKSQSPVTVFLETFNKTSVYYRVNEVKCFKDMDRHIESYLELLQGGRKTNKTKGEIH